MSILEKDSRKKTKETDMVGCNVIQDLLLLYRAGECSEESRRLVEEHLAGCTSCRAVWETVQGEDILENSRLPEKTLEEKTEEFQIKKGLKKIRRYWAVSLAALLALALLPVGLTLAKNERAGIGLCFSNLSEAFQAHGYLDALKKKDYRKMFSYYDVEQGYKYMTSTEYANRGDAKEIQRHYQNMGFEAYRQIQEEAFVKRMESLEDAGISVTSADIIYMWERDREDCPGEWEMKIRVVVSAEGKAADIGGLYITFTDKGIKHNMAFGDRTDETLNALHKAVTVRVDVDDLFDEKKYFDQVGFNILSEEDIPMHEEGMINENITDD